MDTRGTRHSDPYQVLVLRPIDPTKTSPTYDDIYMFVEEMLETERVNDESLGRKPELPGKIERLLHLIYKFVGGVINGEAT